MVVCYIRILQCYMLHMCSSASVCELSPRKVVVMSHLILFSQILMIGVLGHDSALNVRLYWAGDNLG